MGAKYTTLATTGYNGSPPADDGSQVAANLITWAGIKTKLSDPVKTLADAENTALVTAFDYSVRQITTNDTTVAGDHMRCVEIAPTVTTAVTISLGDAATMTNVYRVFIKNSSARNQTLTRVTGGDTLDGVAGSVVLAPGEGRIVQTNNGATGYVTVSRFGPFTDGDAIVAGGTDGTKKLRIEVDGLTTATTRVWTAADLDIALGKQPTNTNLTASSGTYTTPAGAVRLEIEFVGSGGGGGGGGAAGAGIGGAGGDVVFNSITAKGGSPGNVNATGGAGGTAGGGSANFRMSGNSGTGSGSTINSQPGTGGVGPWGGQGAGISANVATAGTSATANSGCGGNGGGNANAGGNPGSGAGAGEYVRLIINSPSATYAYTIAAGGTAGAAGTTGGAGAVGATGGIIVREFYN